MMSLMSMSELTKSSYLKEHPVDDNRMSEIKHKSGFKLPDLFKFARAGRTPDLLRCLSDAMENEPNAKGVVDRRCLITGRAVLHEAACFGHRTVIDLLCRDFQANINNKTLMGGDTALHFAAMKNQRAVCFHLITTYGADPEIKNKFGFTPLHYAAMYGSYSLVKCLCQYGAKTATETNEGQTAAQIAHARGAQEEMIDFFLKLAETEGRGDFLEMLEGKKAEMAEEAGAYTAQKVLIQEMEYDKFSKKTMKEYAAWKQPERPSIGREYDPMLSRRGQEVLWRREEEAKKAAQTEDTVREGHRRSEAAAREIQRRSLLPSAAATEASAGSGPSTATARRSR